MGRREAEGRGTSLAMHLCPPRARTPAGAHARAHVRTPQNFSGKAAEVSARLEASVWLEKAGARKPHFVSTRTPQSLRGEGGGGWPALAVPPPPPNLPLSLPDTPGKASAPISCAPPAVTLMTRLEQKPKEGNM